MLCIHVTYLQPVLADERAHHKSWEETQQEARGYGHLPYRLDAHSLYCFIILQRRHSYKGLVNPHHHHSGQQPQATDL